MILCYPIIVGIAIALHLIWAVALVIEPSVHYATGLHAMQTLTGSPLLSASIFVVVAATACAGLITPRLRPRLRVCLILPQQMVLWVSAVSAIQAIFLGTFADGTERTSLFLAVDQVPIILITLGHTAALLLIAGRGRG